VVQAGSLNQSITSGSNAPRHFTLIRGKSISRGQLFYSNVFIHLMVWHEVPHGGL